MTERRAVEIRKSGDLEGAGAASDGVLIIGAGPAGLTAALELSSFGVPAHIVESDAVVGGISRTVEHDGFRFDIGGHRFYTKVDSINRLWKQILGNDLLTRPRLSRIYYGGKFFDYPLKARNVLDNLGIVEAVRCVLSYVYAQLTPRRPEQCFEDWVVNRFGARLYHMFFKSYTEKVWGMSCRDIRAEWAAQRIRGLSLLSAAWHALLPNRPEAPKTLIDRFLYPRLGPGMLWERVAEMVQERGSTLLLSSRVERIHWEPGRITAVEAGGQTFRPKHVLSSMPIRDLIRCLHPAPPAYLRDAAEHFNYRDFLTVALILRKSEAFPDNWIYIHEPSVQVGRIQNYKNWSPEMVPSDDYTCLGLEYFCFEGDGLWSMADDDLVALGRSELRKLNLVDTDAVVGGCVVRMPKAYPVYDATYQQGLTAIRRFLQETPNLQLIGRNGMHHYNNQDHSMLTGVLAARNIAGAQNDLWKVNTEAEYLEEGSEVSDEELDALRTSQPRVPARAAASAD